MASQNANKRKPKAAVKMSPRAEALKKCNDDYREAVKKAKETPDEGRPLRDFDLD